MVAPMVVAGARAAAPQAARFLARGAAGGMGQGATRAAARGALRKAASPGFIDALRQYVLPGSLGEAAMRFAPDVGISALYSAMAPEGYVQGVGERAALFGEDLATQLVPGLVLGGLTGAATRRLGGSHKRAQALAGYGDLAGQIGGPMLAGSVGLRPMSNFLNQRAEREATAQQEQMMQGVFEQGLHAGAQGLAETPMIGAADNALMRALSALYEDV